MTENQKNSGESDSNLNLTDRLKKFEETLDAYIKDYLRLKTSIPSGVEDVLTVPFDELRRLTAEDCCEYVVKLEQYAMFIQLEHNRNKTRFQYAEGVLKKVIASTQSRYQGTDERYLKYELLESRVILNDSLADKASYLMRHASARMSELDNITHRINSLSKAISQLVEVKRFSK